MHSTKTFYHSLNSEWLNGKLKKWKVKYSTFAIVLWYSISLGNRVGTLLADNMRKFAKFESYFNRLESIMREIESALQRFVFRYEFSCKTMFFSYPRFLQAWRSFESRKLCYLPLSSFFIKPISRLYHYYKAIEQMEKREGSFI